MSTSVDDTTILELLRSNDAPRMTTTEVADQLPITRGRTRTRLQQLVEGDKLNRSREGNNVVWWLPEREDELDGEPTAESAEAAETSGSASADEAAPTDEAAAEGGGTEEETEAAGATAAEDDVEPTGEATVGEADEGEPDESRATDEDAGSTAVPEVDAEEGAEEARGEGVGVPTDRDGTTEAPVGGAEAGETEVPVESVDSLEDGDRTPDAEADTRSAAERAGQPEPAPDDEGMRALAAIAVLAVAVLLLRKLFGGRE